MYLTCLLYVFRIILGAGYRSLISSLFNYVHSPVTLSSCGPNIFLSTRSPITLSSVREAKFHTHKKKQAKFSSMFTFTDSELKDKKLEVCHPVVCVKTGKGM